MSRSFSVCVALVGGVVVSLAGVAHAADPAPSPPIAAPPAPAPESPPPPAAAPVPASPDPAPPAAAQGPAPAPAPPASSAVLPPQPSGVSAPATGEPLAPAPSQWTPPPLAASAPAPGPSAGAPPSGPAKGHLPFIHDGFFLRAAAGPGWFHAWTDSNTDTRRFYGTAGNLELSMGGTPGKGFVFGGSVILDKVWGLSSKDDVIDGDEPTLDGVSFTMNVIGVFADYYPDPAGGLDFHAMVGIGTLDTSRPATGSFDNPDGFTFSGGVGYDWFVAEQLSVGVHGRVTIGSLSVQERTTAQNGLSGGVTGVTVFIPSILFAVTYH